MQSAWGGERTYEHHHRSPANARPHLTWLNRGRHKYVAEHPGASADELAAHALELLAQWKSMSAEDINIYIYIYI